VVVPRFDQALFTFQAFQDEGYDHEKANEGRGHDKQDEEEPVGELATAGVRDEVEGTAAELAEAFSSVVGING
jgi:hypothetical protein